MIVVVVVVAGEDGRTTGMYQLVLLSLANLPCYSGSFLPFEFPIDSLLSCSCLCTFRKYTLPSSSLAIYTLVAGYRRINTETEEGWRLGVVVVVFASGEWRWSAEPTNELKGVGRVGTPLPLSNRLPPWVFSRLKLTCRLSFPSSFNRSFEQGEVMGLLQQASSWSCQDASSRRKEKSKGARIHSTKPSSRNEEKQRYFG